METKIFTFTSAGIQASADSQNFFSTIEWARVKLLLQTAGPVALSTFPSPFPIGTKGIQLTPNLWTSVDIPPATRLYLASNTLQQISVMIEPIPYLSASVEVKPAPPDAKETTPGWPFRF